MLRFKVMLAPAWDLFSFVAYDLRPSRGNVRNQRRCHRSMLLYSLSFRSATGTRTTNRAPTRGPYHDQRAPRGPSQMCPACTIGTKTISGSHELPDWS
eukprot:6489041-Amphidinium_carterae.1